ncbi:BMFP domain-containing protein YqiC [Desulfobaculum xiamenense]|uniref:BMFP domain-containing protein YqiC n=1 Tax=Desulfobaculum xiamenense TaxID=995050 RepID=A0A846QQI8_9BACT|nr:LPP20 family lipoprotein [Desulfobaculum xiamenense]NJB67474.1 BMFP domain-containing protein YqiC [Desulfobaculum xiamenense]
MMYRRPILILFVIATLALAALPCAADDAYESVGSVGYIDWTRQRAIASGTGFPPPGLRDPARAHAAARRAAVLDARRNLLEVVRQVRIDSSTLVENLITTSDTVQASVTGALRGSEIESERPLPDGGVTVTVGMALTGELARELMAAAPVAPTSSPSATTPTLQERYASDRLAAADQRMAVLDARIRDLEGQLASLTRELHFARQSAQTPTRPAPTPNTQDATQRALAELSRRLRALEARQSTPPEQTAVPASSPHPAASNPTSQPSPSHALAASNPAPSAAPAPAPTPAPETLAQVQNASGLVIDARGTNFRPSLKPRLTHGGEVLFPGPGADFDTAVSSGFVRYYRDITEAQRAERAGSSPLTLAARGNGSDLELDDESAAALRHLLRSPSNILDRCRVVVVF